MPLYHNVRRTNPNPSGKFLHVARAGVERTHGADYRNWSYHLVRRITGSTMRRAVYSVTITNPSGNWAAYLTDFASPARATTAAREWIDQELASSTAI